MKSYFLRRSVSRGSRRKGKRSTWNCVNVSPCACKYFTAVMTLLLFTGAVVMVILYFHKQKKPTMEKSNAMTIIQEFMILQNESFKRKSDSEILDGVQQLAQYLSQLQSRNDQIEKATNDIIAKLVKGWEPFSGNLYYFSTTILRFYQAKEKCVQQGGHLVDIITRAEEIYLEDQVAGKDGMFYIGLQKDRNVWKWVTGEPLKTSYWGVSVAGGFDGSCAVIFRCTVQAQCWNKAACGGYRKWICKLKPDLKYL